MKKIILNEMKKKTWRHLNVNEAEIIAPYISEEDLDVLKEKDIVKISEHNIICNDDISRSLEEKENDEEITVENWNDNRKIIKKYNSEIAKLKDNFKRQDAYVVSGVYDLDEEDEKTKKTKEKITKLKEEKTEEEILENKKGIHEKYNIVFEGTNDNTYGIHLDNPGLLFSDVSIILEENSRSNILISLNENNIKSYRDNNIMIRGKKNSKANIIILYGIGIGTFSLDSVYVEGDNCDIHISYVFLGSDMQYFKHTNNCMEGCNILVDAMYILDDENSLDILYNSKHFAKDGKSDLAIEGVMLDNSKKIFKGIIDFKEGSSGSIAEEKESVLLLSDNVYQKSLPILLSNESDVTGRHAANIGRVDESKLYYIMSRGFTEEDAKSIIIIGKFQKILSNIHDENIRNMILNVIIGSLISKRNEE